MKSVSTKSVPSAVPPSTEAAIAVPAFRVLKIGSCPSMSGKSTLTYHVGCSAGTGASESCLRVFGNSGGGFFSNEWIELSDIQQAFAKVPSEIAITAHLLSPLFQGKSANTQAFLFAVLKQEGLVSTMKDSKGRYERSDPGKFMAEVEALMASGVDLQIDEAPATVTPEKSLKSVPKKAVNGDIKTKPVAPKPPVSGKKAVKKDSHQQGGNE